MFWTRIFVGVSLNFLIVKGANILFLSCVPSPSHHFWNSAVYYELAKNGHNITAISPNIDEKSPPGVHSLLLEGFYGDTYTEFVKETLKESVAVDPFDEISSFFEISAVFCAESLEKNAIQRLLDYPDDFKFDLILYDYTMGPCLLPLAHKFNYPPIVGMTAYSNPAYTNDIIGGHEYPSYVPYNLMLNDDKMSFRLRLKNFALYVWEHIVREYTHLPALDKLFAKRFGTGLPSAGKLEQKTAIAFVNTNPAMDYLAPLPENVIPVGGLHIKDPKSLPKDLEEFMATSKKGVVLFSLGSNFRSDLMPIEKQKMFIDVFRQLRDYHFLWKFESDIPASELPKNVQIRSWLPLSDALAHPNVKAIIMHGGLLTTQEAVWRGVPLIVMPFGFDQNQNLYKAKRMGMGEGFNYVGLNSTDIKETLLKVLEDPSYQANAKKWSKKYQDQKEKPLERAIWWIEWVLRNPDAEQHLKSPVLRLGYIVGNSFDIIALVIVTLMAILFIAFKFIQFLLRWFCSNQKSKSKKD